MTTAPRNRYFALRHGHSLANARGLIIADERSGHDGFGLTPEGRDQVVASISACGFLGRDTVIFSSPFLRARESAELARDLLGCASFSLDARLGERSFGILEGASDRHYADVWADDERGVDSPVCGVEPVTSVRKRLVELVQELEGRYSGSRVLLVAHGDPLQILRTVFAGRPTSEHRRQGALDPGQLIELGPAPRY
jgi:probable phosphoglycerate mutase